MKRLFLFIFFIIFAVIFTNCGHLKRPFKKNNPDKKKGYGLHLQISSPNIKYS